MATVNFRYSSHIASGVKSCGGSVIDSGSGIIPSTTGLNELFDKVLKHENIQGVTDYRLIYLKNDSSSTAYSLGVKILSSDDDEISIGALSKNVTGETLATETEAPSSVVFKTQDQLDSSSGGYITFPSGQELAPEEFCGLWLKRSVSSSSGSGTKRSELVLEARYRQ